MISVLVVNHNGEAHLGRCLDSFREPEPEREVIVVDNASTDGSLALLESDYPEVQVLPQSTNLGFGTANNLAARAASGDRLLLVNADAWLQQGALSVLDRRLRQDDGLGLVAPSLRYPNGRLQFGWSPARGILGEMLQKLRNPYEASAWPHGRFIRRICSVAGRPWYTAACVLLRASAFHEVGGFDSGYFMYFEDVDLCHRLERCGWRLDEERSAIVYHAGGLSREGVSADLYRPSQLRFYAVHRPRWEQRLLKWYLRRSYDSEVIDRWLNEARRS
jgi:GT2 family glycosyltransferase